MPDPNYNPFVPDLGVIVRSAGSITIENWDGSSIVSNTYSYDETNYPIVPPPYIAQPVFYVDGNYVSAVKQGSFYKLQNMDSWVASFPLNSPQKLYSARQEVIDGSSTITLLTNSSFSFKNIGNKFPIKFTFDLVFYPDAGSPTIVSPDQSLEIPASGDSVGPYNLDPPAGLGSLTFENAKVFIPWIN